MRSVQQEVYHLSQALQCSATLEDVSPNMKICHLAIPWCGRQLHWQVLLPAAPHSAPDILMDDDSFRPLCGPPLPHYPHPHSLESLGAPGRQAASTQAALRALLRAWPSSSTPAPVAAVESSSADGVGGQPLVRLVCLLLEGYREHQLARLGAAAAGFAGGLPRLQFELSTLELGPGVQMELQQQQACFCLRLPPLDLHRFLELAKQYGAVLPPQLQPQQQQRRDAQTAGRDATPGAGPGSGVPGSASGDSAASQASADEASGPGPGPTAPQPQPHPDGDALGQQGPGPGSGAVRGPPGQLPSGLEFSLLAAFRLPSAGGGSGDLADPELTLQLPRALQQIKAQEAASSAASAASASAPISASASSSASSPSSSPSLVPSFLLPLWTPHMCLAEYVPLAVERLQSQLDAHCGVMAARHQLFDQLSGLLGAPLELNSLGGAALFVVAWEGSTVLVSLELGSRFPTDKPTIVLQCTRVLPGAESSRTYRDYPWSPRWAPGEMAARIHNWMQEELPNFTRGRAPQP